MNFRSASLLAAALMTSVCAYAHDYKAGQVSVGHPYARATVPGQPAAAAYLSIENKGTDADKLLSLSSQIAKNVEIHTMSMEGNVMKMRAVANIELQPAGKVTMKPGDGYHIMMTGLIQPLKTGDKFPLTLTFEKAGKLEVSVWVEETKVGAAASAQHQH